MSILSYYLGPVQMAVFIFPILALALTFPYLVFEYRRYGAVPFLRTLIIYTFILYLINVYFQVILPLPDRDTVASMANPGTQLQPLHFVRQFLADNTFSLHNRSTWIPTLKNVVVYQAILNTALLFPLGVYLHYYFRRGIISSFLICFLVSLFCELTQLSGLYGYYPHAYRLFDVDDLILNTLGGLIGWICSPLLCILLPSREQIDSAAYERGKRVPIFRRFLSFAVDFSLISLLQWVISLVIPETAAGQAMALLISMLFTIIYFTVLPTITEGYTVGKLIFRLRLITRTNKPPTLQQYLLRYSYLSLLIVHLPHYWLLCHTMMQITNGHVFNFWKNFQGVVQILMLLFLIETGIRVFTQKRLYFYEQISGTRNGNMIQ